MKKIPSLLVAILIAGAFLPSLAHAAVEPVAHWKFDEGTGTTATDSSGNSFHGTISGAAYSSTTPPDVDFADPYSLDFDGVNDGVSTAFSLNGFGQFTIAGWAYPRTAEASEGWFGANDMVEFLFNSPTALGCWAGTGRSVSWSFADDADFLNNWHHITCLGDGDNVILYVDGTEVASMTHAHVESYGSGDNFTIGLGVQNGGSSGPFDGLIDDVRVYDVALTPGEMSGLGTGSDEPVDNPVLSSLSPADDAVDVPVSIYDSLVITFSKDVEWTFEADSVRVYEADDDSLFFAQAGGSGSGTSVLSLAFPMEFEYETEYYVIIDADAVVDLEGNPFAGITSSSTWSFTTEQAPPIALATIVTDGVTSVTQTSASMHAQVTDTGGQDLTPYGFHINRAPSAPGAYEEEAADVSTSQGTGAFSMGGEMFECGTTYYYRAYGTNGAGTAYGDEESFSTLACEDDDDSSRRSSRSGGSVQSRVKALEANGNAARATELRAQYAQLFGSAATPGVLTTVRDLEYGMDGEDVRSLQQLLITQGYAIPAGATSWFGPQTQAALSAYQSANGIAPSVGYFGPLTRAQMKGAAMAGSWW